MPYLDDARETFCAEYIKSGCAAEAWRISHPKSKATAASGRRLAAKLLNEGGIQDRIDELRHEAKRIADSSFSVDAEWCLARLVGVVDAGMSTRIDADGNTRFENLAASVAAIRAISAMIPQEANPNELPTTLDALYDTGIDDR